MNFTEQESNLVLEYQMEYMDVLDDTSDEALFDLIKSCQDDDERNLTRDRGTGLKCYLRSSEERGDEADKDLRAEDKDDYECGGLERGRLY